MSVYSGFGTRQQESFYNKLLEKALSLLVDRLVLSFSSGTSALTTIPQNNLQMNIQIDATPASNNHSLTRNTSSKITGAAAGVVNSTSALSV